ncbi:MSMEG_0565 family glycosyltransferase [Paraburkholderia hospita]|uniref:Group 1 glycosyl transferase n=1 Tax=Paraburkholderia hospita TaxID=169430 RepID=A0AAN1JI49_9BURK|nr:MSMEG_0565 family glycosyltransferase [Paraburkholderia hospita]AUT74436.1 MSMEG_0565 family glycosyltransferase [Paraburkholderia hospita]EIN01736.1 group 1 glycosyl transferase [Paraburkholderia hospita]OUL78197.1 glycosyl transferase family 1 [Paraburkholderia hospita]OUL78466.1 glycosyl transferase family 1 [Paraburkholderia hospita]SEH64893.1 glycosyltransferase, MSMEG_0565 family [Paraburkholderia hospita]
MNGTAMRIALFTHSVNPRGGVVHTLELGRALHEAGQDVTIFAPSVGGAPMFRASPCRVVLAPVAAHGNDTVSMVRTRIDALKTALLEDGASGFDVLHAQDSISGNALAELREAGAIRGFVRTVHHLDTFDDPRLSEWQRRAFADADAVFCVSDAWTRKMRDEYGVTASVVNNGVDVMRFRSSGDPDACMKLGVIGKPVVLAVGGIEERKNTLQLLEAFALLRQTHPNAQLVIAGGASLLDHDAYTRRFIARAAQRGLRIGQGEPIVVTGPLDDAAIPALMRRADVVSMVSLREGFGLVTLEALAAGAPVVVSQIEPFTGYLDERVCCWAQPDDAASIADALRRALHGRGGIDFEHAVPELLARFSWHESARRHIALYADYAQHIMQPLGA